MFRRQGKLFLFLLVIHLVYSTLSHLTDCSPPWCPQWWWCRFLWHLWQHTLPWLTSVHTGTLLVRLEKLEAGAVGSATMALDLDPLTPTPPKREPNRNQTQTPGAPHQIPPGHFSTESWSAPHRLAKLARGPRGRPGGVTADQSRLKPDYCRIISKCQLNPFPLQTELSCSQVLVGFLWVSATSSGYTPLPVVSQVSLR